MQPVFIKTEPQEPDAWAENELAAASFGDVRRKRRAVKVLSALGNQPSLSIPAACGGWAETMGAYRLLSNNKVTAKEILKAHCAATMERIKSHKVVLLVQDTTELDYSERQEKMSGLGPLNSDQRYGLHVHPVVAYSPDGICLGVVDVKTVIRKKGSLGKGRRRERIHEPLKKRESYRWLLGYKTAQTIAEKLPDTKIIMVADREADMYDIFEEASASLTSPKSGWLIRARHNRALVNAKNSAEETYLFEEALKTPKQGEIKFKLRSEGGKPERDVVLAVHGTREDIRPPSRKHEKLSPQTISIVIAKEISPPEGEEPIEWRLISNLPVDTFEELELLIHHYICRWNIEIFFRTLKSGCKVEKLQLEKRDRLLPCLMFYHIATWRILYVMMLGRNCPDLPCNVVFDDEEWQAVYVVSYKTPPPKKVPTLKEMIVLIASYGGYLNRTNDPLPGPTAMWIGLQRTRDFALAIRAFQMTAT